MAGLRPEHQIDKRGARRDALPLLAGHTAADTDDHMRAKLFEEPPFPQQGEHFLLSLFPHRTGIDQQDVRLGRVIGAPHAVGRLEYVPHLAGIVFVHLTAEGFYV